MSHFVAAAATTDPTTGRLLLAAAAVVWALGYAAACWAWPFARCRRCGGTGTRPSPTGRHFRRCRRCKATGRRIRTGRRIFNYLHVTNKAANN